MSFVIARIPAQLSKRWSVAAAGACTTICINSTISSAGGTSSYRVTYHLSRVDLRYDRLDSTSVVESFKVHEQQPTCELNLRYRRNKLRRRLLRSFLHHVPTVSRQHIHKIPSKLAFNSSSALTFFISLLRLRGRYTSLLIYSPE